MDVPHAGARRGRGHQADRRAGPREGARDDHLRPGRVRLAALRSGASGLLLKDTPSAQLVAALRSVASGEAVVSPRVTRRLLDRFVGSGGRPLRTRDAERADRAGARGAGADRAGAVQRRDRAEVFLSEATVKTHVGRMLSKLDLRDRVQAVVLAYETGLTPSGVRPESPYLRVKSGSPQGGYRIPPPFG